MGAADGSSVELIAIDPIQTDRATTHQPGAKFSVLKAQADELVALGVAKLTKPARKGKGEAKTEDEPEGDA